MCYLDNHCYKRNANTGQPEMSKTELVEPSCCGETTFGAESIQQE